MKIERVRDELCARLRSRQPEIEAAVANRVGAITDPDEIIGADYASNMRGALATAIEYGLSALEVGERRSPAVPPALSAQARVTARSGVALETVLGRYFAGYTLLLDFTIEEADAGDLPKFILRDLLRGQGAVFERLISEVSEEFRREAAGRLISSEQQRADRVRRLLAGELIDSTDLSYELDDWHIGAVAGGAGAGEALNDLARSLDRRPLLIPRDDGTVWAWLGCRREVAQEETYKRIAEQWPDELRLAVGEPAKGRAGWRLSHRQATMAFPLTRSDCSRPMVRYSEVALDASILQDDLLTASLRQLYLDPLAGESDGGRSLRDTLRAYFAAERNVSSTSAALGIARQTVSRRLQRVESSLGRDINNCAAELEAALRLDELRDAEPAFQSGIPAL
jgi:hypothetical protein